MSKSIGNVIWTKDLKCDPRAYRLLVLSFPYRNIIPYTDELQNQFVQELNRLDTTYGKLFYYLDINNLFDNDYKDDTYNELIKKFDDANDNDLNTPNGLTVINETTKLINQELRGSKDSKKLVSLYNLLDTMLHIYGLDKKYNRMDDDTLRTYNDWMNARANKDFNKADELRKVLTEKGIIL